MATRSKIRDYLQTVLFMFTVTLVFISAVSLIHLATQDAVARNESLFLRRGVMEAAGADVPDSVDAIAEWYKTRVQGVVTNAATGKIDHFLIGEPGQAAPSGYVFQSSGAGLWGTINALVGLDAKLKTFTGFSVLSHSETPGLGARMTEDWFKKQFSGKTGPLKLVPEKTKTSSPTEMDAITGATITSKAVRDIMNKTVASAAERLGTGSASGTN